MKSNPVVGLMTCCLLSGCAVTDVTKAPQFSWFVPGRVYALKQEMRIMLYSRDVWGRRHAALYSIQENGLSDQPAVAAGTRLTLKNITRSATFMTAPQFNYESVILEGPQNGTLVEIRRLTKIDHAAHKDENPAPADGFDTDYVTEEHK